MNINFSSLLAAGAIGLTLGGCMTAPVKPTAAATPPAPAVAPAAAVAAVPREYAVVNLSTSVDASADVTWQKIGGYCDIAAWLKLPCVLTLGSGEVGTVRRLANRIDELMVAKTAHSYTYTQPTTTILYHGTLEVVADGQDHSKILYNLIWDQAPLTSDDAKTKDRAQRTKSFTAALANMKAIAEAK